MSDVTSPVSGNEKPKPVRAQNVPDADIDFGNLGKKVSAKWATAPWLTLQWTTAAEFDAKTKRYTATLDARLKKGGMRPQVTKAIKIVEKKIDDALPNVKGYLLEKYGKDASKSYYAAFGIVLTRTTYTFPKDQTGRSKALELLITAIDKNGFSDKQYGSAFWKAIQTEYDSLLDNATDTDGEVSNKVGDKNVLKKDIKKALNALINIIKGNYPDTFKTELRTWGFQKEKY
jgi:hypothetical protein